MPARQRPCGGCSRDVAAVETNAAGVGVRPPAIRLNSVVLPAPFGPMMPSASPGATTRSRSSATLSEPKLFFRPATSQHEMSTRRAIRRSASILPPTGIAGAVLLSVMTISYLPSLSRHWPPTSGVLATFLAAKGGRFAPPHCTLPTTVSRLVAAMRRSDRFGVAASGARFSTSTATSNSAWTKPIGCVHCFLVAA